MAKDNTLDKFLWAEKYRPRTLNNMVLETPVRTALESYITQQNIPHLLFYGSAGSGKTTIAKILMDSIPCSTLVLNASGKDRGIETMRNDVVAFARAMPPKGVKLKIVFLDECIEENETVRVGTVDNYKDVPIKDVPVNEAFPVVSFNRETGQLENDTAFLCTDKEDELYEVEFDDGTVMRCNSNHPFVVFNEDGTSEKIRLKDGIIGKACKAL